METADSKPGILFTVFEPSGDRLAAPVVARLRKAMPDVPIYAWGGEHMKRMGARIVEDTCDEAHMMLPGLSVIREHIAIQKRVRDFVHDEPVLLHVPVDSPAANFPLCKITRKEGCGVVHLVAPQLWAWAEGRIRKLRRCTDLVLCLLPFEEEWFSSRSVPALYIGHPMFDESLVEPSDIDPRELPQGAPRLALLPGSRVGEVRRNFPLMVRSFRELQHRHRNIAAVAVAVNDTIAENMERIADPMPASMSIMIDKMQEVLTWSDVAVVASGTATLQVARSGTPMIAMYKMRRGLIWLMYHTIGPFFMNTKLFAMPNVLAGEEIVEEFIPHFGGHSAITRSVDRYLEDSRLGANQVARFAPILKPFEGICASENACEAIARMYLRRLNARES